eukprot:530780-Rhodomonas_salina.1
MAGLCQDHLLPPHPPHNLASSKPPSLRLSPHCTTARTHCTHYGSTTLSRDDERGVTCTVMCAARGAE